MAPKKTEEHVQEHPNNWHKPFWRSVFSDEFGTGSTSRIATLEIVMVTMAIVIYLTIRNGQIPEHLIQLGWFSSLMITAVYSPAKIASVFKAFYARK